MPDSIFSTQVLVPRGVPGICDRIGKSACTKTLQGAALTSGMVGKSDDPDILICGLKDCFAGRVSAAHRTAQLFTANSCAVCS